MELSYDEKVKRVVASYAIDPFGISKTKVADFFKVSPRTIGRWVDYYDSWIDYNFINDIVSYRVSDALIEDTNGVYYLDYTGIKYTLDDEEQQNVDTSKSDDKQVKFDGIILPTTIVVVQDGIPKQIHKDHQYFSKIKTLIEENVKLSDAGIPQISESILTSIYSLVDVKKGLEEYSNGAIKVTKDGVTFNGKVINNQSLTTRLIRALVEDGDEDTLEALTNFLSKLKENPSFTVVDRLYDFIGEKDIRITKEGNLICFKVVCGDYLDKHSRTFDNSPGMTPTIERSEVDDDHSKECSYGLHVCNKKYINTFYSVGNRIVEVEVNPKDWVTVCPDYSFSKSRVCSYKVLRDVTDEIIAELSL